MMMIPLIVAALNITDIAQLIAIVVVTAILVWAVTAYLKLPEPFKGGVILLVIVGAVVLALRVMGVM